MKCESHSDTSTEISVCLRARAASKCPWSRKTKWSRARVWCVIDAIAIRIGAKCMLHVVRWTWKLPYYHLFFFFFRCLCLSRPLSFCLFKCGNSICLWKQKCNCSEAKIAIAFLQGRKIVDTQCKSYTKYNQRSCSTAVTCGLNRI